MVHPRELQIVDPVMTLAVGTQQSIVAPGSLILPDKVNVGGKWHVRYPIYGNEHLRHYDTRRPMRARFREVGYAIKWGEQDMARHGIAGAADKDELANADSFLQYELHLRVLARDIVEADIEIGRAGILTDPATYPAANVVSAAGREWNGPGGFFETCRELLDVLLGVTIYQPEHVHLFLPWHFWRAAQEDPIWAGRRQNQTSAIPTLQEAASHLGIGEVHAANWIVANDGDDSTSFLYDTAIMWVVPPSIQTTVWGTQEFGRTAVLNRGVATREYFDPDTSTWKFPWERHALPVITNAALAGLITDAVLPAGPPAARLGTARSGTEVVIDTKAVDEMRTPDPDGGTKPRRGK